ncbi:hypothetical protein [Lactococcus lactis]|uniref:hypothetical protein n=1 Tax=Lactococcus lactis TaxID=1358 RepID=UPI0029059DBF|nr:hypothetical protein [Lactococcus lactis]
MSDDDKWYGKVDKKTKSIVEKVAGSLPKTGEGKAALGFQSLCSFIRSCCIS